MRASRIAQASDDQAILNFYAYSPYGETSVLGPDGGNSLRYTGREDDGTGLYYYRARFYSPELKRFIQEDPIGLLGGINLYAYVTGNPVQYIDPNGNFQVTPFELMLTEIFLASEHYSIGMLISVPRTSGCAIV